MFLLSYLLELEVLKYLQSFSRIGWITTISPVRLQLVSRP